DQGCVLDYLGSIDLNDITQGELTPFTDCYVADENTMVDFYLIDLSDAEGQTQLRIEANAEFFWPSMGIFSADEEERDIMPSMGGQPPFAIEAVLQPGQYVLYLFGGYHTHEEAFNVP